MKKVLLLLCLLLGALILFGCGDANERGQDAVHEHATVWYTDDMGHIKTFSCGCHYEKTTSPHIDADKNGHCDECDYNLDALDELSDMFKTAYANSFKEDFEIDLNNIEIMDYFGMIGDAHIVSINSSYLSKGYPDDAYYQSVEGMVFRYDTTYKVYVIHNEKLYSAKSAYENNIIDYNALCKIFGLHTPKTDTFNETIDDKLESSMKLNEPEYAELYELSKYYGEYNGYYAVSYRFLGMQIAVSFDEQYNNLNFSYGYQTGRIRLMNETEMYTLDEALKKGIITDEDLYELFNVHTKSEGVNKELVDYLLTPAYELCLKYKDDFAQEFTFDDFSLARYYGEYGGSYIFSLEFWNPFNYKNTTATEDEIEIMKYYFGSMAYVLNNGKLYTLDQALEADLVTKEIKKEITDKYYGLG